MGPADMKVNSQTVVIVSGLDPKIPNFCVAPRAWTDTLLNLFDSNLVKLPGQREFNKAFTLWCELPDAVEGVFSDETVDLLLEAKATVEFKAGEMIFFLHNRLASPEDIEEMVDQATEIADSIE